MLSALREAEDRAAEVDLVPEVYDIRFEDYYSREELERYDIVLAKDNNIME